MKSAETRVTRKYQTTIPKEIRKYLKVKPRETVTWHVLRSMVVVDSHQKSTRSGQILELSDEGKDEPRCGQARQRK